MKEICKHCKGTGEIEVCERCNNTGWICRWPLIAEEMLDPKRKKNIPGYYDYIPFDPCDNPDCKVKITVTN